MDRIIRATAGDGEIKMAVIEVRELVQRAREIHGLSKIAAAECCVRTLTGVGETETSYSLHYCPVHSPVAKAAEDLMSAAVTEEQQAEAWKKAADMWRAAIEEEYSRCVGASTGMLRDVRRQRGARGQRV